MQQPSVQRINHVCLIILAAVALTVALIYTRTIMVLLVFSFFLYTVLSTGIGLIDKVVKIQKWISVTLMMLMIILLFFGLIVMMTNSIEQFVSGAEAYQVKILEFIAWLEKKFASYGYDIDTSVAQSMTNLPVFSYIQGLTTSIISFVGQTFLVFIMTLFMILGKQKSDIDNPLVTEIHASVSNYITIKTIVSFLTGVLVFLILTMFNVELAFMFGVLTFLMNFIPSIGSIIATFLPMPVVLLHFGFSVQALVILLLVTVTQVMIGNVIEPKFMGERLDMHPVTVLVSLLFWGLVWGVPGMFLAVPVTAVIKIILGKIQSTRSIALLMSGQIPSQF